MPSIKIFECALPIFTNEMVSSLPGHVKHLMHQLGGTIYSSVYSTFKGKFLNGYLVDNCNWKNIKEHLEKSSDLSILHKECRSGLDIEIENIFTDRENNSRILLKQAITPYQNGTASILNELYEANDNMFSKDGIIQYLGLTDCKAETAMATLKKYDDYLQSLIPTTTEATTTEEQPISILSRALEALGIPVENRTSTEIGEMVLNAFNISFTDPTTTTTADDANESNYTGAYVAAGVLGGIALGTALGYTIKYGWDWYKDKGKNKEKINDENKLLLNKIDDSEPINQFCNNYKDISSLLRKLQSQPGNEYSIEDKFSDENYQDIENDNQQIVKSLLQNLLTEIQNSFGKQPLKIPGEIIDNIHKLNTLSFDLCPARETLSSLKENLQKFSSSFSNDHHSKFSAPSDISESFTSRPNLDEIDFTGVVVDQQ